MLPPGGGRSHCTAAITEVLLIILIILMVKNKQTKKKTIHISCRFVAPSLSFDDFAFQIWMAALMGSMRTGNLSQQQEGGIRQASPGLKDEDACCVSTVESLKNPLLHTSSDQQWPADVAVGSPHAAEVTCLQRAKRYQWKQKTT